MEASAIAEPGTATEDDFINMRAMNESVHKYGPGSPSISSGVASRDILLIYSVTRSTDIALFSTYSRTKLALYTPKLLAI